jgi:hypothetical protein
MSPTTDRAPVPADDVRLANLHLRVGMLSLALAELEDLEQRELLGDDERSMLAEARWRSGDADGAAVAARAHLESGGSDPIALCIAAEAAAAEGKPGEARSLMDRLGPPDAATLDALFAGMPRRAFWPSAPPEPGEAETLFGEVGRIAESRTAADRRPAPRAHDEVVASPRARESAVPGPRDVLSASEGLWSGNGEAGDAAPAARHDAEAAPGAAARRPRGAAPSLDQDPVAELAQAKAELPTDPERALLRLALTLRLDPTLAPAVLDLVAHRREPIAALLRGDAQRLLGRHLEAEAAFAAVAAGLTEVDVKPRS